MQRGLVERLVGSLSKVLKACWEFAGSSLKGSDACREFTKSLSKVLEARCEFAESLLKVIESLPVWRREFARRRPKDSSEDHRGLSKSLTRVMRALLDLMVT
ncbi:hypothetical protein BHE74_00024734 [Ensete ventricosum]|nr:hypothetical protein BHE74_00024734 [Ensete ventricosum]